ncbi:hypothetical protein OH782_42390 (plasmid) [Streptomyces sp. NBC_01544]|uniref:hypothetical protein n=1 Tax=Streptomyces sp. NBC_01544 TaxID=2975871 RepID=UPI00386E1491
MQTSTFPSVRALGQLLDGLGAGTARRRQLDMVCGELERALARGALPVGARRSLQRLLEEEALRPYVRLAESGALRHRRVAGVDFGSATGPAPEGLLAAVGTPPATTVSLPAGWR